MGRRHCGLADVNQAVPPASNGRITDYPRIWGHVHDGCCRLKDLKALAEAAIAPIVDQARRDRAIEVAEMGGNDGAYERTIIARATVGARCASHLFNSRFYLYF